MQKITMSEALQCTSPQPVSIVCSPMPGGMVNLATVAWWTYLESDPAMIGFSMWKESFTYALLQGGGSLALCIPGEVIADETLKCGTVSGRDVSKAIEYNIELYPAKVPFPVHSRVSFICTIEKMVEVGDCGFFICNIEEIYFSEEERQIFAWGSSQNLAPLTCNIN